MSVMMLAFGIGAGFMGMIVMLRMGSRRIERMREPRPCRGRLIFFIAIFSPAFAFKVKVGCRQKLAQLVAATTRTLA